MNENHQHYGPYKIFKVTHKRRKIPKIDPFV